MNRVTDLFDNTILSIIIVHEVQKIEYRETGKEKYLKRMIETFPKLMKNST